VKQITFSVVVFIFFLISQTLEALTGYARTHTQLHFPCVYTRIVLKEELLLIL